MEYIDQKRRFLDEGQEPTLPFVVEFIDGRRGEALTPLHLMDLIIHKDYSDIDEFETYHILALKTLRDIAASHFSMNQTRAVVYDALGPFYDNGIPTYEDEEKEEQTLAFDSQVTLDGWDAWTVVASLIKSGYLKVYEKMPVWSDQKKNQGCSSCSFRAVSENGDYCTVWDSAAATEIWNTLCPFVTNGAEYPDYHEVDPAEIIDGSYKHKWVSIEGRAKEFIGLRPIKNV